MMQVAMPAVNVNCTTDRNCRAKNQIDTAAPEDWYDAVNNLANRLIASPQDTKLKQEWTDLLKSVGLQNLAQEPLIGSVQISQQSLHHYLLLRN